MLVTLQNHLICSPEPALELANKYIQEEDLKLITLQGSPQGVSLLLLPPGMLLLRSAKKTSPAICRKIS